MSFVSKTDLCIRDSAKKLFYLNGFIFFLPVNIENTWFDLDDISLIFFVMIQNLYINYTEKYLYAITFAKEWSKTLIRLIKVVCRVKSNTTWTTKNTTCSHYFSKKFKTNTLHGHKKYLKIFEFEINNLRIQILAAKMTQFLLKILPFARSKSLYN